MSRLGVLKQAGSKSNPPVVSISMAWSVCVYSVNVPLCVLDAARMQNNGKVDRTTSANEHEVLET